MVQVALETEAILREKGFAVTVVNILSIKPLDITGIEKVIKRCGKFITLENGFISGGIGEYIYSRIDSSLCARRLFNGGFPEKFISHGTVNELFSENRLDPQSIAVRIEKGISAKKSSRK